MEKVEDAQYRFQEGWCGCRDVCSPTLPSVLIILPHFYPFLLVVISVNYSHLCPSQLGQLSLCASPLSFPNPNHDALWALISGEWFSYAFWPPASYLKPCWNCLQKWPQEKETSLLVVSIWCFEILCTGVHWYVKTSVPEFTVMLGF